MNGRQYPTWACFGALLLHLSAAELWSASKAGGELRVGAAAAEIASDDSMPVSGSIFPLYWKGQEAPLRAKALVVQSNITIAIVSVDVLVVPRDIADLAAREIETQVGIPFGNIMISATHNHSAPGTCDVHAVKGNEVFRTNVKNAIVAAAKAAKDKLQPAALYFALGQEATVGHNSRFLLSDGTIYWVGPRGDALRPTGPFDPQLPVFAFKGTHGNLISLLFNHSSHNIGSRANKRSPAFYGLAEQELEKELGGIDLFVPGAVGSTHVHDLSTDERVLRIKNAVKETYAEVQERNVAGIRSIKKEFTYHVRHFDEQKEEQAVSYYCNKRIPNHPERTIEVFREERRQIAPHQGEARQTWLHVLVIGDIAFVGVPGEMFGKLGMEIKRRSPFRYTYVIGLANDWIGYLPDPAGFDAGGYQVWTGLHSVVERGTGEAIVDEAVRMLKPLAPACGTTTGVSARRQSGF